MDGSFINGVSVHVGFLELGSTYTSFESGSTLIAFRQQGPTFVSASLSDEKVNAATSDLELLCDREVAIIPIRVGPGSFPSEGEITQQLVGRSTTTTYHQTA
jgi:hypothetical protein